MLKLLRPSYFRVTNHIISPDGIITYYGRVNKFFYPDPP